MPPPACGHHRITSCGASTPDSVAYNNHPETPKLAQFRKKPLTWALAISSQLSNRLTGSFNLPLFGTKLHFKGACWYPHNHKGGNSACHRVMYCSFKWGVGQSNVFIFVCHTHFLILCFLLMLWLAV